MRCLAYRRASLAACAALALGACAKPAPGLADGGHGSTGDGGTGGFTPADAGPPSARELCLRLWAGEARAQILEGLPIFPGVASQIEPGCPSPTPAQLAAISQFTQEAGAELLTLAPPDGGWPDGSGPSICENPALAFQGLPAQMEAAIANGHARFDPAADATCQQGLRANQELLAVFVSNGATYPGEADSIQPDGGGPCSQIFEGTLGDGGACLYPFECRPGLYCRAGGGDGSCAGLCAPLVPPQGVCGPLDVCADQLACASGFCGGPDAGPAPTPIALGAPCDGSVPCQGCLRCLPAPGSDGGSVCGTQGLAGDACTSDSDCANALLYCAQLSCQPAAVLGASCFMGSAQACLVGWCEPLFQGSPTGSCVAPSPQTGPCLAGADCAANLFCSVDGGSGSLGSCASYPNLGGACGSPPWLSSVCPVGAYCQEGSSGIGSCVALPGAGSPCSPAGCAEGSSCDSTGGPPGLCRGLPGNGQTCVPSVGCTTGLTCLAGFCASPLPGGAACSQGSDCASQRCLAGLCGSPCATSDNGCQGQELSFLLGLGGAVVLFDRRRKRL